MIRIEIDAKMPKPEKRYRICEVAKAVGKTEGAVQGYYTNRDISTKQGVTLEQITAMVKGRTRGDGVRWDDVNEIRERLYEEKGIHIIEE